MPKFIPSQLNHIIWFSGILPTPPLNVRVTATSASTITLEWEKPDFNCDTCQYTAMIWLEDDASSLLSGVSQMSL